MLPPILERVFLGAKGLGYEYALGGYVITGLIFCVVAIMIKFVGTDWINAVLPPAAMGPVVALIGLELAGTAAANGGIILTKIYKEYDFKLVGVFIITLLVAIFGQVLFRGLPEIRQSRASILLFLKHVFLLHQL